MLLFKMVYYTPKVKNLV